MVLPPQAAAARRKRLARTTSAVLEDRVYQDDSTAEENLALFDLFDRWTASLFAEYWGIAPATARKRLGHLADAGVIVCIAGAVFGHGGREPDLFVLTAHGALVLDYLRGRPRNTTKAPQLARDSATAEGGPKAKHLAGVSTPHILNCLRLALRQGWLDDERWRILHRLDGRRGDGERVDPVPDFALASADELIAVEVEGTLHRAHINEKHRRYAALAGRLREKHSQTFGVFLTVVFTFPSDTDYQHARRLHELAFARQGRDYGLYLARLANVLAARPDTNLWDVEERIDREAIRQREREHHDRQRRLYDDW